MVEEKFWPLKHFSTSEHILLYQKYYIRFIMISKVTTRVEGYPKEPFLLGFWLWKEVMDITDWILLPLDRGSYRSCRNKRTMSTICWGLFKKRWFLKVVRAVNCTNYRGIMIKAIYQDYQVAEKWSDAFFQKTPEAYIHNYVFWKMPECVGNHLGLQESKNRTVCKDDCCNVIHWTNHYQF